MASITSRLERYPELDGLRGIAILLAIFANTLMLGRPDAGADEDLVRRFASSGWIGVQLFFVLSGFLITEILIDTKSQPHYFRNFYARRALRILPAYVVLLVVVTVLTARRGEGLPIHPLCHWLFMTNACIAYVDHWIDYLGPIWSLAVEEHFYLFWPIVVVLMSNRGLIRAASIVIAASLALRCVMTAWDAPHIAIYVLTPTRLDGLAAGALIAAVRKEQIAPGRLETAGRVLFLAGLAAMAGTVVHTGGFNYFEPAVQTFGYLALTSLAAGLVLLLVAIPDPGRPIRRLMRSKVLVTLGFYSYAMYLFHSLIHRRILRWPIFEGPNGNYYLDMTLEKQLVLTGAVLVLSFAVAVVSYVVIEKHFLDLRRFVARKTPDAAASASVVRVDS